MTVKLFRNFKGQCHEKMCENLGIWRLTLVIILLAMDLLDGGIFSNSWQYDNLAFAFFHVPNFFRFFKSTKSNKISFWIIRMDAWQVIFWQEKEEFSYGIWIRSFFKTKKSIQIFAGYPFGVANVQIFAVISILNEFHGLSCIVGKHFRTKKQIEIRTECLAK